MAEVLIDLPTLDITVGEDRWRHEIGDIDGLATSIATFGLLVPILIDKEHKLIAGHRRLEAAKHLGLTTVPCRVIERDELDDLTKREMEYEENVRRKDFTWQEQVEALAALHRLKQEKYGESKQHVGGGWTLQDSADYAGLGLSSASRDIALADAMVKHPDIRGAKNKFAATKMALRLREQQILAELSARSSKAEFNLTHGDAVEWLTGLADESVDLIFTDPPYGIDYAQFDQTKPYPDIAEDILSLLTRVFKECYRVLGHDRVLLVWFDIRHYARLTTVLRDTGFFVYAHPIVWCKEGGSGMLPTRAHYARNYETLLYASKGTRELNAPGVFDWLILPKMTFDARVHPVQKPIVLLKRFIEQHSLPGELVIDPFAGSGSTIIAALQLKRKAAGCELDDNFYNAALLNIEESMKADATISLDDDAEITDFHQLKPGTLAWMTYWKNHPEDQDAMLTHARVIENGETEGTSQTDA